MTQTDIASMIATAVAAAISANKPAKSASKSKAKGKPAAKGKPGRKPLSDTERAEFMARNDADTVAVFTAAGFKNVKPRENVLTFKKWIEQGRMVRKGEHAHRVGPFNLFHIDQTDEITASGVTAAREAGAEQATAH